MNNENIFTFTTPCDRVVPLSLRNVDTNVCRAVSMRAAADELCRRVVGRFCGCVNTRSHTTGLRSSQASSSSGSCWKEHNDFHVLLHPDSPGRVLTRKNDDEQNSPAQTVSSQNSRGPFLRERTLEGASVFIFILNPRTFPTNGTISQEVPLTRHELWCCAPATCHYHRLHRPHM